MPVNGAITYHDPCRLNKRKGIWQEPRELLRAIPGLRFEDVDRVTQWSYCSGGGGGLPIEKPELTAKISAMRLDRAAELDIDTLVSACPWSERPLSEAGDAAGHRRGRPARAASRSRSASPSAAPGGTIGDQRLAQERSGVPGRDRRRRGCGGGGAAGLRWGGERCGCGCGGH